MHKIKRILVVGAGGAAAHNFIESLRISPEKFYIVGTDCKKFHIELSGADIWYEMPPAGHPDYVKLLNKLIIKEKIDLVHPQPDVEVKRLSDDRDKIKGAQLFLPSKKAIDITQNKFIFNQKIAKAGLTVVESFYVNDKKSLINSFKELKKDNEKIWIRAIHGAGSKAALPLTKVEQAIFWIQYWIEMKGLSWKDFMISEFLPGKEYAFQSLWKDGNILMSQARERIEYLFGNLMPSGQSSSPSIAKTVNSKEVNEAAFKAVKTIDSKATGIFCVDLKENKFGIPCVTEVNAGRFFTTSNFFSQAGLNMPYIYVKIALQEKINLSSYKPFDNLPSNLYWVRMVDMGYKIIKKGQWKIKKI